MIHAKDDGNTLLHFASRVGYMLLIRRLLQQGEDINAKNRALFYSDRQLLQSAAVK
jgi:ankyrin repeat protein